VTAFDPFLEQSPLQALANVCKQWATFTMDRVDTGQGQSLSLFTSQE
jgi:hypothetical protein